MNVAVTDTHALIWYAIGPTRKLGKGARTLFARAERRQAVIYLPVFALVEVAEAMHRGVLRVDEGFSRWARRLLSSGMFVATDLTPDILFAAEGLYTIPERGDRLIAATAIQLDCPLISRDPALSKAPGVTTVW